MTTLEIGKEYTSITYQRRTIVAIVGDEIRWISATGGNSGACSRQTFRQWQTDRYYSGQDPTAIPDFSSMARQDAIMRLKTKIGNWLRTCAASELPLEYWRACESVKHLEAIGRGERDTMDARLWAAREAYRTMEQMTWKRVMI